MSDDSDGTIDPRLAILATLKISIEHDDYIWGFGEPRGSYMHIDAKTSLCSFGKGLIDNYNSGLNRKDIIGRVFVDFPELFVTWSWQANKSQATGDLFEHIPKRKRKHLMFSGIRSLGGYTWLTLYRSEDKPAFNAQEAEYGRYSIPKLLFDWQHKLQTTSDLAKKPWPQTKLPRLTPYQVAIAIEYAKGTKARDVEKILTELIPPDPGKKRTRTTIRNEYKKALIKLAIEPNEVVATLLGRPPEANDNERATSMLMSADHLGQSPIED